MFFTRARLDFVILARLVPNDKVKIRPSLLCPFIARPIYRAEAVENEGKGLLLS